MMMPRLLENEELARMAADRSERNGPMDAELPSESVGRWYVLKVQPNNEGIASGHLIGRRFGVFHPQFPVTSISRGRKRSTMRSLFPGYLFVFVWDLKRNYRRILACTGVTGFVTDCNGAPVIVPDKEIDQVRIEENKKRPVLYITEVIKFRKRRKKHQQKTVREETCVGTGEIISISAYSAWTGITELADDERISKLHLALGLAS